MGKNSFLFLLLFNAHMLPSLNAHITHAKWARYSLCEVLNVSFNAFLVYCLGLQSWQETRKPVLAFNAPVCENPYGQMNAFLQTWCK